MTVAMLVVACGPPVTVGEVTDTDAAATDAENGDSPVSMPSDGEGDGDGPASGEPDPTTGAGDDAGSTGPDVEPQGCEMASLFEPGTSTGITVDVDGTARSYDLFVPAGYDPSVRTPLVINFHGLYGSPSQQADFSEFNGAANNHGMLVAYPEGIGASFNAGLCCGTASSNDVDDVGFARELVRDVSLKMCVDPKRVYATGMSNGGHMAHRIACEAADVFAATASVAGKIRVAPCEPARPISIMQFHGTADTIVSYGGAPPADDMMASWAARNGCDATPETDFDQGDMACQTWPNCTAGVEVRLCTIEGGGHCWPGNGSCIFGHSSTELHASEEIATMFDEQPMP
jgi:polyhydroxybutyrate depolymerase